MSEIKFIAWNIQQKKFIKIAAIDFRYGNPSVTVQGEPPHHYDHSYPADENILMQFSGLLDRHEKELFTKDIFDIGQTVNGQSRFVLIECVGGFDVRYAHDLNRKYEYDVNDLFKPSYFEGVVEFEIIGNIYENPELL